MDGRTSLQRIVRGYGLAAGAVSLVVGFLCASSGYYLETGDCPISWMLVLKTLLYALAFFSAFVFLSLLSHGVFDSGKRGLSESGSAERSRKASLPKAGRTFLSASIRRFVDEGDWRLAAFVLSIVMALAWLPYLIMLYPGIVWWDTSNQMWQYLVMVDDGGFAQITDHHPIFDTMLFGGALQFGSQFLGGDRHGLFLLVLLQSYATALSFALCCLFLRRQLHVRYAVAVGVFAFFSLCPLFPIWTASLAKDTFFSWVFVLWVLGFSFLVMHKGRFSNISQVTLFVAVTLLVCLTKKTGMYIVLPALMLVAVMYRKNGVSHALVPFVLASVAMFVVVPSIIASFGMTSGGKQEMLAVPLSQTARVVADHGDDVTAEERASIDALLGYDNLAQRYDPLNADSVKGWNELGSDDEYLAWLGTYLAQGMRHPLTYADALLALESGWFSFAPGAAFPFDSSHHKMEAEDVVSEGFFERSETGTALAEGVSRLYDAMSAVPVIGLLTSRAFWTAFIPAMFLIAVLRARDKRAAVLLFAPLALSFVLLVASPISSPDNIEASRYSLPFLYCGVLWLAFALRIVRCDTIAVRERRSSAASRPRAKQSGGFHTGG